MLKRWVTFFDEYFLLISTGFLFAFIPLYVKLPLFELIPGYIVRVRLEDILILFVVTIYLIQIYRQKASWQTPFTWLIFAYAITGIISTLSGVYLTKTIPFEPIHIGKSMLHYFRYLEYFSLFFVAFNAVKKPQHAKVILLIFTLTVLSVSLYGIGQKCCYWPVYSTMNREFSKGIRLYLTEFARVQSTFGGHYDLAGYLVIALPVLASLSLHQKKLSLNLVMVILSTLILYFCWRLIFFGAMFSPNILLNLLPIFLSFAFLSFWDKKLVISLLYMLAFISGVWLIIVTSSRSSFIAYLVAIAVVVTMLASQQSTWVKRIWWWSSRGTLMALITFSVVGMFGTALYERFLQTLEGYPQLNVQYHQLNALKKELVHGEIAMIFSDYSTQELPRNGISVEDAENVLVSSDTQPIPDPSRPADVFVDVPNVVLISTTSADGTATQSMVQVPRTYSQNALDHGLSLAIRLDTLWPQAITGFKRNPLFGSGYATLTKSQVVQFTEAESTDNNFLRTLGETGLLGFITFYGVILIGMIEATKAFMKKDQLIKALAVGYIAATLGLLFNAIYIDVFAASKIAFSYWLLSGVLLALFVEQKTLR